MPHSTTPMRSVTRLLTHSLLLAALLFAAARLPAQAKEYRLTHSADTQHPNHIAAVEMAKRIAERTKDEVQLKMHPNNELGAPPETTEQVRLGVVDFAIFPHLDHPELPENTMADAERWFAGMRVPAYAIDDETAIKVVDGAVDVVSEGHWKLFTP